MKHLNVMTLPELIRLSGFTLPPVKPSDPPAWRTLPRGTVPEATREQIRGLARWGLFDDPIDWKEVQRPGKFVMYRWRRPKVSQGSPQIFGVLDLACVRLAGWLKREGLSGVQIKTALRGGPSNARAVLHFTRAGLRDDSELWIKGLDAWLLERSFIESLWTCNDAMRFPIAWLGLQSNVLPRLHKMREDAPTITVHRQEVPITRLAAEYQQQQPAV